jgi:hypothetical protein
MFRKFSRKTAVVVRVKGPLEGQVVSFPSSPSSRPSTCAISRLLAASVRIQSPTASPRPRSGASKRPVIAGRLVRELGRQLQKPPLPWPRRTICLPHRACLPPGRAGSAPVPALDTSGRSSGRLRRMERRGWPQSRSARRPPPKPQRQQYLLAGACEQNWILVSPTRGLGVAKGFVSPVHRYQRANTPAPVFPPDERRFSEKIQEFLIMPRRQQR